MIRLQLYLRHNQIQKKVKKKNIRKNIKNDPQNMVLVKKQPTNGRLHLIIFFNILTRFSFHIHRKIETIDNTHHQQTHPVIASDYTDNVHHHYQQQQQQHVVAAPPANQS
jgi:hypothetical protein